MNISVIYDSTAKFEFEWEFLCKLPILLNVGTCKSGGALIFGLIPCMCVHISKSIL